MLINIINLGRNIVSNVFYHNCNNVLEMQMYMHELLVQRRLDHFLIGLFCILGIELDLACSGGSCGGISLKIFACEKIAPHEPRLQTTMEVISSWDTCENHPKNHQRII